jgi:hypothetical protein
MNLQENINRIRQVMGLNEVEHIYQPTGNSCGPTCIKMVGDFIKGNVPSIDEICKICGTDWVVGTPPEKMKIGLDELGIIYKEHIDEIEPYQSIRNVIDKGNVAIVRTITQEIPHWIVIHGYNKDVFTVNDPWLGPKTYNEDELGSIWKVRNHFFYEIMSGQQKVAEDVVIERMTEDDVKEIFGKLADVFDKTGMSNKQIWDEVKHFKMSLSVVAKVNDKLAGFYFIGDKQIPKSPTGGKVYEELSQLNGVEGIALGVFKEYKNMNVGKKIIEYPKNLNGVDYIWGYQFKSLKNIDDWLKRRKIYYENSGLYITYQLFV